MRLALISFAAVMVGCGDPPPAAPPKDPTTEPAYIQSVRDLAGMNRDAERFLAEGKHDDASALILKGEPVATQILGVPRPTLAAMEAASDVDELYGKMLLSNRNYGWARLQFQKNLARWKYWKPQTPESVERMKKAESEIEECDRGMLK